MSTTTTLTPGPLFFFSKIFLRDAEWEPAQFASAPFQIIPFDRERKYGSLYLVIVTKTIDRTDNHATFLAARSVGHVAIKLHADKAAAAAKGRRSS